MKFIYLQSLKELDTFVINTGSDFLQSSIWGEMLKKEGYEVIRVGVRGEDNWQAVATLHKIETSLGYYLYCPRGPVGTKKGIEFLINNIKKNYRGAIFLRIETKDLSLGRKTINIQPQKSIQLDLKLDQEELLKAMHQKTRYNIHLSERKGLEWREAKLNDFSEFWRLMTITSNRDSFRIHNKKHYRNLLSNSQGSVFMFFVSYNNINIATGLFSFWGERVSYLHGGSDNQFRNLMAPYLLQWKAIKLAKEKGYKYYDFYGIDEKKWPGVSRFKKGFGGQIIEYTGTRDIVFCPLRYYLYSFLRFLRHLW